jgi:putative membrane protein
MMYHYGTGMGAGGWMLMSVVSLAFLGLLIAACVAIVRRLDRSAPATPPAGSVEQTLADRYAHGDIDTEEYEQRLRTLRANRR